ncbi:MAG: hypothetical protein ABH851_09670 [Methanobacteriota archaeon]
MTPPAEKTFKLRENKIVKNNCLTSRNYGGFTILNSDVMTILTVNENNSRI